MSRSRRSRTRQGRTDPGVREAENALREREAELRELTSDWTILSLSRTYPATANGEQDYADEAMILGEYQYDRAADWTETSVSVRYTKGEPDEIERLVANRPRTIVRAYKGKQQADALIAFQEEAEELASYGYVPTAQSWAPGQWGPWAFVVAIVLFVVVVGLLVFFYMIVVKPEGTLTVTYARG